MRLSPTERREKLERLRTDPRWRQAQSAMQDLLDEQPWASTHEMVEYAAEIIGADLERPATRRWLFFIASQTGYRDGSF